MKSIRKISKERNFRRGIIYFLTCSLILNTSLPGVLALEATDVISSTGAVPTQWGDHTIIKTQHGAIIDWSNFNTSSAQSVTFNQYMGSVKDGASAVLNRISSGSVPTMFNGVLNANGRVFIVNPAGVVFGAGSTVNVTQLVASGLNMSNDAFGAVLADEGNPMVFEGGAGQVKNYGSIEADSVHLIGKRIENLGTIAAPEGLVVMAAGDNVYLAQDGSNVFVELHEGSTNPADNIVNEGSVTVGNGKIVLAAGDTFSSAITEVDTLAAAPSANETSTESSDSGEDSSGGETRQVVIGCYPEPEPEPEPKPKPEPEPEPKREPTPTLAALYTAAPLPEDIELEYSGCSALMAWAADELGIDERMMQIWTSSALASTQDIQPCDSCARLKAVATVLQDAEGTRTAALAQVINEFASRTPAPLSPEEMTLIASAIADNTDADSHYAKARVYLDALSMYVSTLNSELNFSTEESILFAADRYVAPLAEESQNDSVVAFIAARLVDLGG